MQKQLLVIAGPTAAGKTAAAIQLAQQLGARTDASPDPKPLPILSFDSRQCYRELNIGVARPSPAELEAAPHHFIATHSIHETISAAAFETYALDLLDTLFRVHDTVIAVGGTGLYLKALLEGMDPMPEIREGIRDSLQDILHTQGLEALQQLIREEDPRFAEDGDLHNPQRIIRALEVIRSSGKSIRDFQLSGPVRRPFQYRAVVLDLPRQELYDRINQRTDQMMAAGLLAEARALFPYRHLNALRTVGYAELFDYFDGKYELDQAVDLIRQHTRNYAKRQLTWFRKQAGWTWVNSADAVVDLLREPAKI